MSGFKGTPGPWHVAAGVQIRSLRDQIAKVWMMRSGEGKANAQLISAAPELLDALQMCEQAMKSCLPDFNPYDQAAYDKARAAIAKALGEQQ